MNDSMNSSQTDSPVEQPQMVEENKTANSDETVVVDLRYVFKVLLKWSWLVILATGYGIYTGSQDAHNFVPQSVASTVLGPFDMGGASSSTSAGTLGGGGLTGGAAVLSMLSNGGGVAGMTSVDKLVHMVGTLGFARHIEEKYGLMKRIYASSWDSEKGMWKPLPKKPEGWRQEMEDYLNYPKPRHRTIEDLASFFKGILQVSVVEGTPYQEIRVVMEDEVLALGILELVLEEGSKILLQKQNLNVEAQSRFLEERLSRARLIDHKKALVALLSEQARKEMMMAGDSAPMFDMIEPPFISVRKTEPNVRRLIGVPGLIGFFGSSLLIIVISVFRRE